MKNLREEESLSRLKGLVSYITSQVPSFTAWIQLNGPFKEREHITRGVSWNVQTLPLARSHPRIIFIYPHRPSSFTLRDPFDSSTYVSL